MKSPRILNIIQKAPGNISNGKILIGLNHPPKKRIEPKAHKSKIFAYSPNQNIAYIIPEYSGMMYAMFWLGEYANILLLCALGSILFLGGWLSPINIYPFNIVPGAFWMIFKILGLFILFSLVKAIVPRYRFDQLMRLGWKIFLPLSLIWVVLTASFLFFLDMLPITG